MCFSISTFLLNFKCHCPEYIEVSLNFKLFSKLSKKDFISTTKLKLMAMFESEVSKTKVMTFLPQALGNCFRQSENKAHDTLLWIWTNGKREDAFCNTATHVTGDLADRVKSSSLQWCDKRNSLLPEKGLGRVSEMAPNLLNLCEGLQTTLSQLMLPFDGFGGLLWKPAEIILIVCQLTTDNDKDVTSSVRCTWNAVQGLLPDFSQLCKKK